MRLFFMVMAVNLVACDAIFERRISGVKDRSQAVCAELLAEYDKIEAEILNEVGSESVSCNTVADCTTYQPIGHPSGLTCPGIANVEWKKAYEETNAKFAQKTGIILEKYRSQDCGQASGLCGQTNELICLEGKCEARREPDLTTCEGGLAAYEKIVERVETKVGEPVYTCAVSEDCVVSKPIESYHSGCNNWRSYNKTWMDSFLSELNSFSAQISEIDNSLPGVSSCPVPAVIVECKGKPMTAKCMASKCAL